MRYAVLILTLVLLTLPVWPDQITEFSREVEILRGHQFHHPVDHRVLVRADLKAFLATQMERELPVGIDTYLATIEALGLVDSSASVDSLLELYDAQVLAFYDPVEHVYYSLDELPSDVALPPMMIDAVVVHELVHALQDQTFDAGRRSQEIQSNWDASLAYQSLLEGEALLVMIAHLGKAMGLSLDDLVEQETIVSAVRESAAAEVNVPEDVPAYFVESLKFPYVDGLGFVVDLYREGGWEAIDRAHRMPPMSTEELIHPDVYRSRVSGASGMTAPKRSEPSSRLVETVLGEFHWTFLLGTEAGKGWSSDLVSVRHGENGSTVLVDSTWDDEVEAAEFEAAYRAFLESRGATNRHVTRQGARVKAAFGADAVSTQLFARESVQAEPADQ